MFLCESLWQTGQVREKYSITVTLAAGLAKGHFLERPGSINSATVAGVVRLALIAGSSVE